MFKKTLYVFLITVILSELALSFLIFSFGHGTSKISKRWFNKYWKPINSEGFRDFEKSFTKENTIIFLGDSFTAGHGVKFQETFYFLTRKKLNNYNFVNLSKNGSSTLDQLSYINEFYLKYDTSTKYLVHQYFLNDIDDYLEKIEINKNFFQKVMLRISEIYNLADSLYYSYKFSKIYEKKIYNAYNNEKILKKNLSDVKEIHNLVHKKKGNVVFLIFPFLNSDTTIRNSKLIIDKLKINFLNNCINKDVLIDLSLLARNLNSKDRIVNVMDAHPSKKFHHYISELLVRMFLNNDTIDNKHIIYCKK